MTSLEFKEARISLGLSQNQLGIILDTNPATIRKWEAEDDRNTSRSPNPVASRVMSWMLAGYRPPEWPVIEENRS
ncbi:MAG: helix-turn-helix domain-containing protein [Halocynthiibacter sp.]